MIVWSRDDGATDLVDIWCASGSVSLVVPNVLTEKDCPGAPWTQ